MYRLELSRRLGTSKRLCRESGRDFNTEFTESTEDEDASGDSPRYWRDIAPDLKFEMEI